MQFEMTAQARTLQGSGASRRLRRAGKVPGIIYGGDAAPQPIELDHKELLFNLKKEAFHSSILNLVVAGKKQQVLHVDFQRVSATEEVHILVPLHFINEESAPGVKLSGGLVNHVITEVDVQCLPKNLPEFIEVDVGTLDVGEAIHVSELKLPKGVKLASHATDEAVVVGIVAKGGSSEEGAEGEGEAAAE